MDIKLRAVCGGAGEMVDGTEKTIDAVALALYRDLLPGVHVIGRRTEDPPSKTEDGAP
jgi:hypothetical protein